MNTNLTLRRVSNVFRFVTILAMLLMNMGGVFPVIQANAETTTIFLRDDTTGGDCTNVGNWNLDSKTCTLIGDINTATITLASDGITLDGASYTLTGQGAANTYGVTINGRSNVTVRNLIVTGFDTGIFVTNTNNSVIENNTTHHNINIGISITYSSQNRIQQNLTYGQGSGMGILLSSGGQNTLENNVIRDNKEGLRTGNTTYNIIQHNTISGQSNYPGGGILLFSGSHYNTLSGNDFINNYWGIYIHDSSNQNTIEGNSFSNNTKAIEVTWSVQNLISTNTMSGNNTGIDMGVRAGENTIRNNSIIGGTFGIMLGSSGWLASNGSYSNVVTENTVSGASFANIHLDRTNNNQIFRNNFIGSAAHNNDGSGTTFDAGLELGGNYWTAYDTSSEGCTDTNGDAYCDLPYLLEAGYQDNYPWVSQDGWLNQRPIANAGGPYTAVIDQPITLDASASSDPDGDTLTFEWDLDNDGEYDDAVGISTSTSFNQPGEYTIGLRVTDALGLTATSTAMVTISADPNLGVIHAYPENDFVDFQGCPLGRSYTITIDDPSTGPGGDYSDVQSPVPADWDPAIGYVAFPLNNFDLRAGQTVQITDGTSSRTLVVTEPGTISFDVAADRVSGTMRPGSFVDVYISATGTRRYMTADLNGNWTVDFATMIPGDPNNGTYDIVPGTNGTLFEWDVDGDRTGYAWQVPPSPGFLVRTDQEQVHTFCWPEGTQVTLTIDDPINGSSIDYSDTGTIVYAPGTGCDLAYNFELKGIFDIRPGVIVTISGGSIALTHQTTSLTITNVDVATNIVYGTAEPGSLVTMEVPAYNRDLGTVRYEIAGVDGKWQANFSQPGDEPGEEGTFDIGPGSSGEAYQNNQDGWTYVSFDIPNPVIKVWVNENSVDGYDWTVGVLVTISVDDPSTPETTVDYTDTQTPYHPDWDPNGSYVRFNLGDVYHLKPGDMVTMTNGIVTKTHQITHVTIIGADPQTDTVSGTAWPGSEVGICIHINGCLWRWETADGAGNWTANFSVEQNGNPIYDIQLGTSMDAVQWEDDGDGTGYIYNVPDPRIFVEPNEDNVHAWGWPEGTLLILTIDDPNSTNDYTANQVASESEDWNHGFMLGGIFDIQPGFVVTVSGGGLTKEHTVTPLAVTNIDIDADKVSGVGLPGSWVHVGTVCDDTGCANRNITVGDDSTWLADFSTPQIGNVDGGMVFDIRLGSDSGAFEHDEDGDSTKVNWSVFNPIIGVEVDTERVQGWDWPLGATVHFEFDDPSTSENPDYTYDAISQPSNWDPNSMWFDFYSEYDIKPGDIVTATDGHVTKELVVTTYRITSVDLDTDIVYGIANPYQPVSVWTCYPGACINRSGVTADTDGIWIANFGIPGEREGEIVVDLRAGSGIDSFVEDEDGDETRWMWSVPNPILAVRANEDKVEGWEWTPDTTITITVDDPATPAEPDITRFANVYEASWNPGEYRFDLNLNGVIDIQPGFVVTASNGNVMKSHIVQPLEFTEIDLDADTVHGIAASDQTVNIWTCWQNVCINRDETADANGNWSTNFSIPGEQDWEQATADLRPGSWIDSSVNDDDNDSTMYGWSVPNPNLSARLTDNEVHGYSWPLGVTVTLTIDDPDTVEPVDYTDSQTTMVSDWDPNQTFVQFRLWENGFTLEPGMTVTMGDGNITKTHVVTDLMVTAADPTMDTVSGTAEPGAQIEVGHIYCDENGCHGYRRVTADANGEWIVDFAHVGEDSDEQDIIDITIGMGNEARQCDEDGDCTQYGWYVPSYTLHAVPAHPEVHGHDWPAGSDVTLIIDDDSDPTNGVLYTRTKNADDDPWCGYPCFDLAGEFELEVGQYVIMTDGLASKMVLVSRLKITDVDYEHETVSGIADPGSRVAVNIWSQDGKARYVTTDANGHWIADFSVFGDEDFEQFTTDITSEDNGRAIQLNPDGSDDGTLEYWPVFNNPPVADAGPDQTIYARDLVLLDASASSDPDGDTLTYEWDINNDGQYDDANGVTVATTFSLPGTYTVGLLVTDDGGLSSMDMVTITVSPWTLRGFYQPVDMNGVYNVVKGGSTVPLKFEIFAGPTELMDTAAVKSLTYAQTACDANAITDEIEVVATGATSLRYDTASGQFIFNWKTPRTAGTCYRVTMTAMDGSYLVAYFKLK